MGRGLTQSHQVKETPDRLSPIIDRKSRYIATDVSKKQHLYEHVKPYAIYNLPMAYRFEIHPDNPHPRLIKQAVNLLQEGKVLAVPTDSGYALACQLDDKAACDHMRRLRGVDDKHHLTLLCRDLSELANFARVDNMQYRMLKIATPGPFTFILEATKEVPRRLSHPARKTIGLRVSPHVVLQAILQEHRAALLATTLILPESEQPLYDADEIEEALGNNLGAIVDAGACANMPTTVIDLSTMNKGGVPKILREGAGDASLIGLD